jgi:dTDP-4-amino-4,6-dideoxygalactose transaminase
VWRLARRDGTISELARVKSIAVIHDSAQAHGARIHGQSVASFFVVAAWSLS